MIGDPHCSDITRFSTLQRVSLRPFIEADGPTITEALQDHELARWLAALPLPAEKHATDRYLQFLGDPDVLARVVCFDEALIGVISLGTELSFWIKPALHRRGLGFWAVQRFLDQLPEGTQCVEACCMLENTTAIEFLNQLGFERAAPPFRRFSFAHGHAVDFLRFEFHRSCPDLPAGRPDDRTPE